MNYGEMCMNSLGLNLSRIPLIMKSSYNSCRCHTKCRLEFTIVAPEIPFDVKGISIARGKYESKGSLGLTRTPTIFQDRKQAKVHFRSTFIEIEGY